MKQEKPDENGRAASPGARSEAKTSVDESAGGGADDRLVGRTEAARLVGLSVATLRRLERTVLRPVVDGSGVHRHIVKRLLYYKADRASSGADVDGREGALAAAAFKYFDRSLGAADVVKLLRVAPSVARELYREWADLGGGFVVSGEAAVRIERLALNDDDAPVRSNVDLLRLLKRLDEPQCSGCKRRTPCFCLRCFVHRPQQVAKEAITRSETRQSARYQQELERHMAERARMRAPAADAMLPRMPASAKSRTAG